MRKRGWTRLDNASKIFLAARTARDTKVFRLSAALKEPVDPELLQEALDASYDAFKVYQVVIRRGIFWYYLEQTKMRPVVEKEEASPCAEIYHYDVKRLLFRVLYYKRRISLEVFHSLSDGAGALAFFKDLLCRYFNLRHPERAIDPRVWQGPAKDQIGSGEDAFERYFGKRAKDEGQVLPKVTSPKGRIYRQKGTGTSDLRLNVVEAQMSLSALQKQSRRLGVSLTMYLAAILLLSLRDGMPERHKKDRMTLAIPMDLRGHYASQTLRNFFATVTLDIRFDQEEHDLESLCKVLKADFEARCQPALMEDKLKRLMRFEEHPLIRLIVRPLKDLILSQINAKQRREISASLSNLGRFVLPEAFEDLLEAMVVSVAVMRPQYCAISYGDTMVVTLLSPHEERDWQTRFLARLAAEGVPSLRDENVLPSEAEAALPNAGMERVHTKKQKKRSRKQRKLERQKQVPVEERSPEDSAYPLVPLLSHTHLALKILSFLSLSLVGLSFLIRMVFPSVINWPVLVVMGTVNLWAIVGLMIRKHRNIAKALVYQSVTLSLIALSWDYFLGWQNWSLDYAIPIIFSSVLVAIFIAVRLVKMAPEAYVLYLMMAAILGLLPVLFISWKWVTVWLPSFLCAGLALVLLVAILSFYGGAVWDELGRRMHL